MGCTFAFQFRSYDYDYDYEGFMAHHLLGEPPTTSAPEPPAIENPAAVSPTP